MHLVIGVHPIYLGFNAGFVFALIVITAPVAVDFWLNSGKVTKSLLTKAARFLDSLE